MAADRSDYSRQYYEKNKDRLKTQREKTRAKRLAYQKKYYAQHRDQLVENSKNRYHANKNEWNLRRIEKKYGLVPTEFERLHFEQEGKCAICGGTPERKRLAVDHNHQTGEVRGLLCLRCNTALGSLGDKVELLEKAIAYLRKERK